MQAVLQSLLVSFAMVALSVGQSLVVAQGPYGLHTGQELPSSLFEAQLILVLSNQILCSWLQVSSALESGLLGVRDLDAALERTLMVRFKTGQFDHHSANPWRDLKISMLNNERSRTAARVTTEKGKNEFACRICTRLSWQACSVFVLCCMHWG
jgi:hypothetical protein